MKTKERNKIGTTFYLRLILGIFIVAAVGQSCTKLDETLYSNVTPANFFKSDQEFVSALGAAYTQLGNYASQETYALQELTTDEMTCPTRGQDWDDGGNWRRLHLHSWKTEDNAVTNAWSFDFAGINTCNRLIYQFQSLSASGQVNASTAASYIAELRTLRGFFYWQLVDMYGNVPMDTSFVNVSAAPPTASRSTIYNMLISDLEAAVPLLTRTVGGTAYGRINYYAGKCLLAKLYLNAGVYVNAPAWANVVAACDTIINSGKYSLESNYFTNFNVNNSGSKEFIFAIPYDKVFFTGFECGAQSLHYGNQYTYNLQYQPWNGFCTLQEFYNSYSDNDLRKGDVGTLQGPQKRRGNFLAGYQYRADGATLVTDDGFEAPNPTRQPAPLLGDPDGAPLNFGNMFSTQPQINELGPQAYRQSGVRIGKWEYEIGGTSEMSNDWCVFRYADVLLMKAEALWRISNNSQDPQVLALVNQIRERAGLTDLTTIDSALSFDLAGGTVAGGELFNEMGREMFAEHNRRQDLIRWGYFTDNDKWVLPFYNPGDVLNSGSSFSYLTIFPLGRAVLSANPNLVQNPGY